MGRLTLSGMAMIRQRMRALEERVYNAGGWVALGGPGAVEIPGTRRDYTGPADLTWEADGDWDVRYLLRGWGAGAPILIGMEPGPRLLREHDRLHVGVPTIRAD